jgi:hypothetical protein
MFIHSGAPKRARRHCCAGIRRHADKTAFQELPSRKALPAARALGVERFAVERVKADRKAGDDAGLDQRAHLVGDRRDAGGRKAYPGGNTVVVHGDRRGRADRRHGIVLPEHDRVGAVAGEISTLRHQNMAVARQCPGRQYALDLVGAKLANIGRNSLADHRGLTPVSHNRH